MDAMLNDRLFPIVQPESIHARFCFAASDYLPDA